MLTPTADESKKPLIFKGCFSFFSLPFKIKKRKNAKQTIPKIDTIISHVTPKFSRFGAKNSTFIIMKFGDINEEF